MGPQPEIDRVVDRFSAAGYAAVAPDLFAGRGKFTCIRELMAACASGAGRPVADVLAARAWLCETAGLAEPKIGLVGFCITGGFALAIGRGWPVISANYGAIPPTELMRGIGPVIACYGGRDRMFGRYAPVLRETLQSLGVEAEVHEFPTVGHSLLTDGHHPVLSFLSRPLMHPGYGGEVAEEAWRRIFRFFDRHLEID
jgi:carboxymethylenebutenolidase